MQNKHTTNTCPNCDPVAEYICPDCFNNLHDFGFYDLDPEYAWTEDKETERELKLLTENGY